MLGLVVAVIAPLAVLVVAPNRAENAPVISAH